MNACRVCLAALGLVGAALAPRAGAATAEEIAGLVPDDAAVALVMPSAERFINGALDFLRASGAEVGDETPAEALAELVHLQGQASGETGLDVTGVAVAFLDANFRNIGSILQLEDRARFAKAMSDIAIGEREAAGCPVWLLGQIDASGTPQIVQALAVSDDLVLMAPDLPRLEALLAPTGASPLSAEIAFPGPDSVRLWVDMAALAARHGPMIERAATTIGAVAAAQSPGGAAAHMFTVFTQMMRSAVSAARQMTPLTLTVTPSTETLRADLSLGFQEGSGILSLLPRHRDVPLTLGERLPGDAMVQVTSTLDGERFAECGAAFMRLMVQGRPGVSPELEAAYAEMERFSRAYYTSAGDELAFALAAAEGQRPMPATVMLLRPPDPQALIDLFANAMAGDWMPLVMRDMCGAAVADTRAEDRGTETVEGLEVRHFQFTGLEDLTAVMTPHASPETAGPLTALDTLDYWFAAQDDLLILVTEPQPQLMGQILRGETAPLARPAFAAPLVQGADAVGCLRLSAALSWVESAMPANLPADVRPPFGQMARALRDVEQGIWGSLTFNETGCTTSVIIPAADLAAIAEATRQEASTQP